MGKGVDLSGLDQFNSASFLENNILETANSGHPLMVDLDHVQPDPDQSRQEFDADRMKELAASIQARGVKSPISVKPPNEDGIYFINHGERRWRAARQAGLTDIPAFIDADHTHYDQVIENIQRENLTPLEIAHFIERCLEAGEKKGQIAKLLGKPASYVSDHAVFFQLPDFVRDLYDSGRCRSIQALALLHRAYKNFPVKVVRFCTGDREIPTSEVRVFVAGLKNTKKQAPEKKQKQQVTPVVEEKEKAEPGIEDKEPSVSELAAGTSSPGAGSAPAAGSSDKGLQENTETNLEADLYQVFEERLQPLEEYLNNVSDPDFLEAAGLRLFRLAELCKR
jgi:ParB family chromosome partitioning protein